MFFKIWLPIGCQKSKRKLYKMSRVKSKKYDGVYLNHLQNGDISYSIIYKDINNKTQRLTIGKKSQGITEQYCNNKRIETINQIILGEQPTSIKKRAKKNIIYLDEVAQKYLIYLEKKTTARSYQDIKSKYNNHLKTLHQKDILSITKDDLLKIQQHMEKIKYSPKTINNVIDLFGTIFNYGLKEELYNQQNPTIKVERYGVDNSRERFLTKGEIQILFDRLQDKELLTLFVKFALITGARLKGLLAIQKKDIDITHGFININDFKTKSTYKAFLTEELKQMIQDKFNELNQNDHIISLDGTQMTDRQIQSRLKPILDELFNEELKDEDRKNRVVIHTLRHTFASHLAINGTPIYTIQKLMNHRDIKMTLRYAKLAPDSGKDFVNDLYR